MTSKTRITLDLKNSESYDNLILHRGDSNSRVIEIELTDDHAPVTLTSGMSATIDASTNGIVVADGEKATVDTANNIISVTVTDNMTSLPGKSKISLTVSEGDTIITAQTFRAMVTDSVINEGSKFEPTGGTVKQFMDEIKAARGNYDNLNARFDSKLDKSATYTKTEVDTALSRKPDKAKSLAGYGITDGENIGNKVTDKRKITDENANYPSVSYLNGYYYDYNEVDDALSGKLDNTAGSVKSENIINGAITNDKLADTVKNDISSKASLIALTETSYLQLKDVNNNVLSSVKLPTSAPSDIRAELNNLVAEGAISGIATGVYNVVDFGAVGDGVTDDTAAFITCINNASGHPVIIPPGTYVVNYANCGDGKAIYLLGIGNPTITRTIAPDGNDEAPLFKFNNVPSAYISGITFDANRDNFLIAATTTKGLDNTVINETEYEEWIDTACIYFYRGGKNIVIENCTFTNCSREGIYCGKGEFADIIVRNNKFKETSACLWLRDGVYENITFEDNYCDGCRTMPVEFDNTDYNDVASVIKNAVVRNNKFYNVCKCAIQFRAIDGLTIENNEYSNRGQLYEHGRKSSDGLVKTFIWGLGKDSDVNTLMAQNVTIRNNKGVTGTVLQLQPNSGCTGSVAQFANIKVVDNNFAVSGSYVSARCTENLSLIRNEMQGSEKSNLLRATAVRNVTIDKNNINSGASIYYEENSGTDGSMVGDGENIKMIDNSANLVAAPFILTKNSYNSNSKIAFELENNKLNTWGLIGANYDYRSYLYSKSRNNVDTSGITSAALGSPTNNKYGFNANSAVDLHSLDTTDATAVDGYVIIRSAVTFAFPGRKIQVIITGQAVKTDTSGTSANKILNEITVPAGGILTLTYTGSGWYAS